jgi:hypothetical protein
MTTQTDDADRGLTIEKLADEFRPLFGQVVLIHGSTLAVLHGVGIDTCDLYYIAAPLGHNREQVWYSAVGHCDGLKDHLPAEIYDRLANTFRLNTDQPDEFQMLTQIAGDDPAPYDAKRHPALLAYHLAAELAANDDEHDEDVGGFFVKNLFR